MYQFWNNLSVTKKLYTVFGVMALLIALELVTLKFVMNTLSSVRSFVGGEGLWSKAQKSAVNSLQKYVITQNESYFKEYEEYLKVTLGDRQARLELEKPNPNLDLVFDGFLKGGIHKNDIAGLVRVITNFHDISYIKSAIELWTAADKKINELTEAAAVLNVQVKDKQFQNAQSTLEKIYLIDKDLTLIENEFSSTLGEGSRWLEGVLMFILLCVVLTIEGTGLMLTFSFSKQLSRSLNEMNNATSLIGQGNFDQVVPVRSQDELGQLAKSINKMSAELKKNIGERKQAESANKIKTLFLANMSHEIRTPLGVIMGLSEILKNENLSSNERRQYLDIIDRTGHNLTQIINDILDISKVESGYLVVENSLFTLPEFLTEIYNMMGMHAKLKKNKVIFTSRGDIPKEIVTDKNRLGQILINLLNNALKFTHNGEVSLTYWASSSQLFFEIADNGIGMTDEQKQHLFTIFYQADPSSTRKYEGTGLGLALSKRLAKALGGDINLVETKVSKGTTFVVNVPFESADSVKFNTTAEKTPEGILNGKKILVVEDNKDNQLLVNLFLEKTGAIIEFANNGEEGYERALSNEYDAVIMDIQMPVLDGYSATKRLRAKGYVKPIIALTAHAMVEERSECLRVGCNDYIAKPVNSSVLYKTIANCILGANKQKLVN